jgi:hypothetical protein
MTVEQKRRIKKTRFGKEKNAPYRPQIGSFESILIEARELYPKEAFTMGSSEFWVDIEGMASMTCEQGCFQFYLAGVGHLQLAERIVNRLNLGAQDKDERVSNIADFLYEKYPQKYKDGIKR